MTPQALKLIRRASVFFIVVGIAALVADYTSDKPTQIRYIIGALVLIGYGAAILFWLRNGPPKSN